MSGTLINSLKAGLTKKALSIVAVLACSGTQAGTLTQAFNYLGEQDAGANITWDFIAGGGSSRLDFELAGYASLDGYNNGYTDIFHLFVNGNEIFTGSFNLGGGGSNTILFNPNGGSAETTTFAAGDDAHNSSEVTWQGGVSQISIPLYLLEGANQITFSYSGDAQGLLDEAWGINQAILTATVPEPAAYGLLLAGMGGLFLGRRRIRNKD